MHRVTSRDHCYFPLCLYCFSTDPAKDHEDVYFVRLSVDFTNICNCKYLSFLVVVVFQLVGL